MAQRPDAYGYHTPPEQQDFLDAAYKKADRITARHSGGDDYITSAYKSPYADMKTSTVDLMHIPSQPGRSRSVEHSVRSRSLDGCRQRTPPHGPQASLCR